MCINHCLEKNLNKYTTFTLELLNTRFINFKVFVWNYQAGSAGSEAPPPKLRGDSVLEHHLCLSWMYFISKKKWQN